MTVTLEGSNSLTSGGSCAGLQKNGVTSKLLLNGDGGLVATSGTGGAAIGGANGKSSGNIEINSKGNASNKIKLITGGTGGAGIGGGEGGNGEHITIGGDVNVTVHSGNNGAGIGGSLGGSGTGISISGGKVKASSSGGAGIGSGARAGTPPIGENIVITDTAYVEAISTGSTGIGGGSGGDAKNIKINGGTVFALGTSTGIGGQNDDATVYIKGVSGTKYPWVFTNKITSSNYAGRYGAGNDGYPGIVFECAGGYDFKNIEDNNFNEGIVYGSNKTVEITEKYTLKTGKKLTVPANVTFATKNMFTLDGSILYLKEKATLDKWYKMEKKNNGEIQHEDSSDYKWYGAEKYEFINTTNYTELYSLNGSGYRRRGDRRYERDRLRYIYMYI